MSKSDNHDSNSASIQGLMQQLESARSDVQFLAAQHADTLKGLHAEIGRLQQSNRELQFQLTFQSEADRVKQLEAQLSKLQLEGTKHQSQLDEQRRKAETKLAKSKSNSETLTKRVAHLENELKNTVSSYQTLVISLEKQNEQQASRLALLNRENTISIRRLPLNQPLVQKRPESPVRPTTPRRLPPLKKPSI